MLQATDEEMDRILSLMRWQMHEQETFLLNLAGNADSAEENFCAPAADREHKKQLREYQNLDWFYGDLLYPTGNWKNKSSPLMEY